MFRNGSKLDFLDVSRTIFAYPTTIFAGSRSRRLHPGDFRKCLHLSESVILILHGTPNFILFILGFKSNGLFPVVFPYKSTQLLSFFLINACQLQHDRPGTCETPGSPGILEEFFATLRHMVFRCF
jgi:hypothetical protein